MRILQQDSEERSGFKKEGKHIKRVNMGGLAGCAGRFDLFGSFTLWFWRTQKKAFKTTTDNMIPTLTSSYTSMKTKQS
ncbi:hypothetical protein HanXRQr2_Chr13g0581411 [Helianthus annuus]|uniref:Uncharacterized protein n=2 Tax=Helianthus annuus TaxID=4232 RepID=A0A9K3H9L8_HELAN|nr:hypothetical protein HanXRQr2_Chr13g0581411 [Helianthus annuus]